MNESKSTPGPWHVNAVDSKRGRIVGDETAPAGTWDKLQINASNRTVAMVYRSKDARLIVRAVNHHAELVEALRAVLQDLESHVTAETNEAGLKDARINCPCWELSIEPARALLARIDGDGGAA